MDRTRTPSTQKLVAGSLLAGTFVLLAFAAAASSSTTGCSSAETKPAPDAALPECKEGPFLFCQIASPGQPSCSTDDVTSSLITRLPKATSYAVGCVVNFVGPRDEQGDCRLDAVCKCVIGDRPVTPTPTPDAGSPADAGDDADAAVAPPPPPPATTTGPMWVCDK